MAGMVPTTLRRAVSAAGLRPLLSCCNGSSSSRRMLHSSAPVGGGAGRPVGFGAPPSVPLPEDDELIWDDGTPNPEPCPDLVAPHVPEWKGLALLGAGLGFFATLGLLAYLDNKAARVPWTPREVIIPPEVVTLDELAEEAA